MGITRYALDPTQGPACSLAAAAATVYRNYFVPLDGQIGQTEGCQINNLDSLANSLGSPGEFFAIKNGYTFSNAKKLKLLKTALADHDSEKLIGSVKVGLQTDTEVSFSRRFIELKRQQVVSQCFCSAVSATYQKTNVELWEPLATLALDAAYEVTLLAAASSKANRVWLTFIGGGAFGNKKEWIGRAIGRALDKLDGTALDVRIGHYKHLDNDMIKIINHQKNESQQLIDRCQNLWDMYCEKPNKKRLSDVFDHLDIMKLL